MNTNPDLEREKTSFEKFEDEVKLTIFNVLYVLLKDEDGSGWKEVLQSVLDFLEIYYFSFATSV